MALTTESFVPCPVNIAPQLWVQDTVYVWDGADGAIVDVGFNWALDPRHVLPAPGLSPWPDWQAYQAAWHFCRDFGVIPTSSFGSH